MYITLLQYMFTMASHSGVRTTDHRDVFYETFILRFDESGLTEFGDTDGELNVDNICRPRSPTRFNMATFLLLNVIISATRTSIFSIHHTTHALHSTCVSLIQHFIRLLHMRFCEQKLCLKTMTKSETDQHFGILVSF